MLFDLYHFLCLLSLTLYVTPFIISLDGGLGCLFEIFLVSSCRLLSFSVSLRIAFSISRFLLFFLPLFLSLFIYFFNLFIWLFWALAVAPGFFSVVACRI